MVVLFKKSVDFLGNCEGSRSQTCFLMSARFCLGFFWHDTLKCLLDFAEVFLLYHVIGGLAIGGGLNVQSKRFCLLVSHIQVSEEI